MARYEWSRLNKLQLGKYAEYFVKMEFTMYGWEVYTAEVDDRGIDFIVRTENGVFLEVQVKSARGGSYIYLEKSKFTLKENLVVAVVLFKEALPPALYLIHSLAWNKPNALLSDRDYKGRESKPEWGIQLSVKNQKLLEQYAFDGVIGSLCGTA